MKINKLKPIKVESQEALEKVERAAKSQTLSVSTPRTFDPNFQIFSFTSNDKHLIYVPNFYTEDEDGNKNLIVEKAYVHAINKGRQFMQIRSTQGLEGLEEMGISGQSPFYEALQECWELYNLKYKLYADSQGIDPNNDVGDVLKPKRQELLGQRIVKEADPRYYFPVVVFETKKDPKTGLNSFNFALDENEQPIYQIMWMDVSDNQWTEKWDKIKDSLEEGDSIAGKLLTLNYHYTDDPSSEKNLRRDSGRALQINKRDIKPELAPFFAQLDEEAKDWTPAKARETIIACAFFSDEDQQEMVDDLMAEARLELAQLKNSALIGGAQPAIGAPQQGQTAEDKLGSFGVETSTEETAGDDQPLSFGAKS